MNHASHPNVFRLRGLTLGAALLAAAGTGPAASAGILVYEGFDYPVGSNLIGQNGGAGFSEAWRRRTGTSLGTSAIQAAGISYDSLATTGGQVFLEGTAGGGSIDPIRTLSATRGTDGTTTWISFLGERTGPTSGTFGPGGTPTYVRAWNVALFDPNGERLAVGDATWSAALGQDNDVWGLIQGGSASNPGTRWSNVSLADPSLVVVRIDHAAGATDKAYLWVNPSLATEPLTASAQATTTGDFTFNQIRLFAGNPNPVGAQGIVDELRVGQTWFDVTPVPEPGEWSVVTGVLLLATGGYWARHRQPTNRTSA